MEEVSAELEAGVEEADCTTDVGVVTVDAAFAAVLQRRQRLCYELDHRNNIPGNSLGDFLGITGIVTADPLAYLHQLRLDILLVQRSELRPDGIVEEDKGVVPSPSHGRNRGPRGKGGCCSITLLDIRLHKYIAWQKDLVISLQNIRPSDIVVWRDGRRDFLHVGSQGLVIFCLCQNLVLSQFRLEIFLPLCLAILLCLRDTWAAILGGISPTGGQHFLVNCLVIWPSELDVWSSVGVVVGLEMRRNSVFYLEVRLADARRFICTLVERRGAAEEDGDNRIPGEEPAGKSG